MTSKMTVAVLTGTAVLALASAVLAADVAAQIKARHDFFHEIGHAMKSSADEMKSGTPSITNLQKYATAIDSLAPKISTLFPAGSGPESGMKTGAKAEIWTKPAEFSQDEKDFVAAAHNYALAAQSGDINATNAARMAVGKTCKTCHDAFRAEEH